MSCTFNFLNKFVIMNNSSGFILAIYSFNVVKLGSVRWDVPGVDGFRFFGQVRDDLQELTLPLVLKKDLFYLNNFCQFFFL